MRIKLIILRTVVLAGASGLVGSSLLHLLLNENRIDQVVTLGRNPLLLKHNKLVEKIVSFNDVESWRGLIKGSAVFCCLGSTRKKTPDLNEYRKVDYTYPLLMAKFASEHKVDQYHIVSALGSNPDSYNFYTKLKGEIERDLKKVPFKSLHIYKPSLITGERKEKRTLEAMGAAIMRIIDPLLAGRLRKYRSIKAESIAKAMLKQYLKDLEGTYVYPSDRIKQLA